MQRIKGAPKACRVSLIAFTRSIIGVMAADPLGEVRGAQDDGIRSDSQQFLSKDLKAWCEAHGVDRGVQEQGTA